MSVAWASFWIKFLSEAGKSTAQPLPYQLFPVYLSLTKVKRSLSSLSLEWLGKDIAILRIRTKSKKKLRELCWFIDS
jgi:hypothetical protein